MATGNKRNLAPIPTVNMMVPAEGPESTFLGIYAMPSSTTLDLNSAETGLKVRAPQTLFFDGSASTGPVTLTFAGTGQTLVLPPQSAGYLPIMTPNEVRLTIMGTQGGSIGLWLLSVPVPAQVWSTAAGGASNTTAAQGLPNTDANAWPIKIVMAGVEIGLANPLPIIAPEDITVTFDGAQPVTINGTPTVNIGTMPNVTIAAMPNVTIAGTAAVSNAVEAAAIAAGAGTVAPPASAIQVGAKVLSALPAYTTARYAGLTMGLDGQLYVNDTLLNTLLNKLSIDNVLPAAASASFSFNLGGTYYPDGNVYASGQQGGVVLNAKGALKVDTTSDVFTYSAGNAGQITSFTTGYVAAFVPASTAKIVRVRKITFSASSATATNGFVLLAINRNNTFFSGGTAGGLAIAAHDPAAPGSVVSAIDIYSTIPTTVPTALVDIRSGAMSLLAANANTTSFEWDFDDHPLNIASTDLLAIRFVGSAAAIISVTFAVEWTEE